ncbi:MAG: hypothetical protein MUC57_15745 [Desulfobacterales bacterium]|nr:hypothetical protein [Desulfobacterales bacterium]
MNDQLISLYIDDELDLDDKIVFVETVHEDKNFKDDAVNLLRQEKLIRADVVDRLPALSIRKQSSPWRLKLFRPLAAAAAGLAAAAIVWLTFWPSPEQPLRPWRFVIYQPDAQGVELAGSFSSWKRIPLKHAGNSGYWEITLELPEGGRPDHRGPRSRRLRRREFHFIGEAVAVKHGIILILAAVLAAGGCAVHYHVVNNGQVEMYLTAPQAQSVVLVVAGEPFQKVQALRDASGTWKATLNQSGEFKYFYIMDDKSYLPDCRLKEHDDFGSDNCVFAP